jgi:hypothetical protein
VTDRSAVRDTRYGGVDSRAITMPTVKIPAGCMCTWSVITPGPGLAAISQLKYANSLCPCRHSAPPPAPREVPDPWAL